MSNRAARRREKREGFDGGMIRLENPVANHFQSFIFGNSTMCDRVVEQNSGTGKHLVICGAGPSLRESAAMYCPGADQVWGCNSALTWLHDNGHKVTHGFTVDQTPHMLSEWQSMPDVEYMLASSVHPHLTEMLAANERKIVFFHNFVGINELPVSYDGYTMAYEDWMYSALFPGTVRAGSGLNAVTRAIDVAMFMNFDKITVLGADCALVCNKPAPNSDIMSPEYQSWLRNDVIMHADGGSALASGATPITLGGVIDGRHWEVKPDLMISAVWLVKMKRKLGDRLELIGDTLPNALADKDDAFLDRLPALTDGNGKPMQVCY